MGSHFVDHILEKYPHYQVITLDALTYAGSIDNLHKVWDNPRHRFVQGRIEDAEIVDTLVAECDVVVNFAAETHVDRSIARPQPFILTNIVGTQVLLEAARRHRSKLFCQVSTDEVYGALELNSDKKFTEEAPLNPTSPYAASKAAADFLVLAYHRTYGLPVVISRSSNNYGPRQHSEKFLPTIIQCALKNKPLPIYGDGYYVREWLYVSDHCSALDLVIHQGKVGQIYNIGSGDEWRNIDLAKEVLRLMGKPQELIQFVADRPGHDRRYALDWNKIKQELHWLPQVSFTEGLTLTINSYIRQGESGEP
jgi:dTDP-glucose 4,6-dehydratase